MGDRHDIPVPGVMLRAAGALVASTLVGVAFVTLTGIGRQAPAPVTEVAEERTLRFDDGSGGEVLVYDAATSEHVATLAVGEGGFVRATLRGLARRTPGAEDRTFRVERHVNGALVLVDPRTTATIDLRAFGPDNAAAFGRYLDSVAVPIRTAKEMNR